ncbi:MAG: 2TM domain-containing protein [Ignavibacteriae bacterium]|nr:2TM domain-containing protein [Ignavibacteriota bacterium]MCB9214851.1 2TM domain-containing protein [Ignavibacteria bacterium]
MSSKQPHYSPEQVQAILERALSRNTGGDPTNITHDELLETARELDIDQKALEEAITDYEQTYLLEDARKRWKIRRKAKFFEHFRAYLIVNAVLAAIDLVTSGGTWFFWPLFGWGIGLAFDAAEAFYPKDRDVERGAIRMVQKEQKERQKQERKQQWHNLANGIRKQFTVENKQGKIIIEKGDRRIEIG